MPNIETRQSGSEPVIQPLHDLETLQAGIEATSNFLGENAEHLGRIFGINNFNITVGEGWKTDLESGQVTADPRFFIEKGYTPNMAAYATMHEVAAHLREVVQQPKLTRDVIGFLKTEHRQGRGEASGIFHNIFGDIAGNNLIHATLDATRETAAELYDTKLFAEADYTNGEALQPRHLQFLYKIIRQEMIPNSQTTVYPEVDELIASFRDFQGKGDLIKFATAVAGSDGREMPARDRFELWTKVIYPEYLKLYEADKQDPDFQQKPGEQGDGEGQPSDGQPQQGDPAEGQPQDGQPQPTQGKPDFSKQYKDYHENRHPEPMGEDEHEKIHRDVEKKQREQERAEREANDPLKQLDKKLQETTGHSLAELKRYQSETEKWREEINAMREIYKLVINERVSSRRRLQGNHTEGVMINPDTVAQTVIDVRAGAVEPAAFIDYEKHRGEREMTGKTDWIFVFDRSGSMGADGRSKAAASSAVIVLEGLAAMQRDVEAAEEEAGMDLDLDIRTALYTFNGEVDCPKPLSHHLTEKERLDAYQLVASPGGDNADSVVLKMIEDITIESDRRKVLVVLSDGEADDTDASRRSVERLRKNGWQVFGIAIGSTAAEELYSPDSKRVDDPKNLPEAIQTLIQSNLA